MIQRILKRVRSQKPLVHCITNYVTTSDCANILLSCGASPVMAEDPREAAEITAASQALVLNLGTLSERRLEAMLLSGKQANALGIPVILDPVGAGASTFRREAVAAVLKTVRVDLIRGNLSEVMAVTIGKAQGKGVDTDPGEGITEMNLRQSAACVRRWSQQLGTVIAVSGALDVVSDGQRVVVCRNGHPDLSRITGTGCMLSAVMGAFAGVSAGQTLEAALAAVCVMGLCGEHAQALSLKSGGITGTGHMKVLLLDSFSWAEEVALKREVRYEYLTV